MIVHSLLYGGNATLNLQGRKCAHEIVAFGNNRLKQAGIRLPIRAVKPILRRNEMKLILSYL
jgi:hypothetical protein